MQKIVKTFKRLFKETYDVKINYRSKNLRRGLNGFCRKISDKEYNIVIDKNLREYSENAEKLYNIVYKGLPKEIIKAAVIVHEFCHVFDFINNIATYHSPTIQEHTVEYFTEYMTWNILLGDKTLAKHYAENYAAFRLPLVNEQAKRSVECSAEVLLYIHKADFKKISEEFYCFAV